MTTAERLAHLLSFLFHPLWVPVFLFSALVRFDPLMGYLLPPGMLWFLFPLLLINAFAPAFSFWLMARGGYISSVRMEGRKERYWPIALVMLYYVMTYGLIRITTPSVSWLLFSFILALIANLGVALVVNFFIKISLHMVALGGAFGVILALQARHGLGPLWLPLAVLLLGGIVAWARLRLSAHSLQEVYLGFVSGAAVSFVLVKSGWVI